MFKKQALKNLTYFRDRKLAQLEGKRKKMKNWQKTYLDQKMHDILFISVCGFVGACEYIINLAKLLPKLLRNVNRTFAISPAWGTQTFGEGWFAFVRRRGYDKAGTYECALINNLMSKFIKEALKNNPMYDEEDVGDIHDGNGEKLGLRAMLDMLKETRKEASLLIDTYVKRKEKYNSPIPAFTNRSIVIHDHSDDDHSDDHSDSSVSEEATPSLEPAETVEIDEHEMASYIEADVEELPPPKPTASEIAQQVVNQVLTTRLMNSYASFLLEQESF